MVQLKNIWDALGTHLGCPFPSEMPLGRGIPKAFAEASIIP